MEVLLKGLLRTLGKAVTFKGRDLWYRCRERFSLLELRVKIEEMANVEQSWLDGHPSENDIAVADEYGEKVMELLIHQRAITTLRIIRTAQKYLIPFPRPQGDPSDPANNWASLDDETLARLMKQIADARRSRTEYIIRVLAPFVPVLIFILGYWLGKKLS